MRNLRAWREDALHPPEELTDSAPAREPSVVHSSFGRLRVHLPHWSGARVEDLVDALRRLPGVTHVEANPLTGNALLLFEPRQTSAQALLDALPALRLEPASLMSDRDNPPAQAEEAARQLALVGESTPHPAGPGVYMTGTGRVV